MLKRGFKKMLADANAAIETVAWWAAPEEREPS